MTSDLYDNPKLTAYALGELEAREVEAIEAEIARDASLQEQVDAIRATAAQIERQLSAEPAPELTVEQRESISSGGGALNSPSIFTTRRLMVAASLAAAACVFVVAGVMLNQQQAGDAADDTFAVGADTAAGEGEAMRQWNAAPAEARTMAPAPSGSAQAVPDPSAATAPVRGADPFTGLQLPGSGPILERSDGASGAAARPPVTRPSTSPPPPPNLPGRRNPDGPPRTAPAPGRGVGAQTTGEAYRTLEVESGTVTERARQDDRRDEREVFNREAYEVINENEFTKPDPTELSTFSIDVDTASFSNVRRMLMSEGRVPPPGAVRIEEFINYFDYDYAPPTEEDEHPFAVHVEVGPAPWNSQHKLARIGLKGYEVDAEMRPATNIVFLLDVSGSMRADNKLPLVKQAMKMLVDRLNGDDRLAIVTYRGNAGVVLDSTYIRDREAIHSAIDGLRAGGSTNGAGGIEVAYRVAQNHFIEGGVNRVILCTDGDFNVGASSDAELVRMIEAKRESDVFLSIFGFGSGNYQDAKMEKLSGAGNGTYGYIDTVREAERVFIKDLSGTLVTIAKDVKVQVDFNPARVGAYRLIGYENRMLAAQDFRDDTKDAGEIGAGHTVTALYEIIPAGEALEAAEVPEKPQSDFVTPGEVVQSDLLLKVKLRYKQPEGDEGIEWKVPVSDGETPLESTSDDFRFAAAVASFGMLLRESKFAGDATFAEVLDLAAGAMTQPGADAAYREDFVRMVQQTRLLTGR